MEVNQPYFDCYPIVTVFSSKARFSSVSFSYILQIAFCAVNSTLMFIGCNFTNNKNHLVETSFPGGPVVIIFSQTSFLNCTFQNNEGGAESHGGALTLLSRGVLDPKPGTPGYIHDMFP